MADETERLSPDDLAFWRHFQRRLEGALEAREVAAQHLAQKYMLGPTRRLCEDGSIEIRSADVPTV